MSAATENNFSIPARYRKMENMHIVFWLIKDISWCMVWQSLGLAMIIPTLSIAILISWRTRQIRSELAHNLAVTFWILANGLWMISEFFHFDTIVIWSWFTGKHLALIPFVLGMLTLANYYLIQKPKEPKELQVATL
jgi:hypothetical protein